MKEEKEDQMKIVYKFNFDEQILLSFEVKINSESLLCENDVTDVEPEWGRLSNFKCPNCPLDEKEHEFCPLTKHLVKVIKFFNTIPSYQEADVIVEMGERVTSKHTTVQIGVGSLLGIIMSTSGCPIIGVLRHLVRFHLPFASLEETEYRVLSTYIFAQYFKFITGGEPDWKLEKLKKAYEEIQIVNKNIVEKLSNVELQDTSRNAVVMLKSFAEFIIFNIEDREYVQLKDILNSFGE